jgi:hypothetical protein
MDTRKLYNFIFSSLTNITVGGDGAIIESGYAQTCPGNTTGKSLATSYHATERRQEIDLLQMGFPKEYLDACPEITVSDWGLSRGDCPGILTLRVTLLDKKNKKIDEYDSGPVTCPHQHWLEIKHTFKNYKKGVRKIVYTDIGSDSKFWAGW